MAEECSRDHHDRPGPVWGFGFRIDFPDFQALSPAQRRPVIARSPS